MDDFANWVYNPDQSYTSDDDMTDDDYDKEMSSHDMACVIVSLSQYNDRLERENVTLYQRVDQLESENAHLRRLAAARLQTMHDQALTIMAQRLALGGGV